jgi:uncharacterized protein (TIGR03083 family)
MACRLTEGQLPLVVPGTPLWTVHDLLAHVVGCPIALVAEEVENAAEDEWTQAQVEARRGVPVPDLLAEWSAASPSIDKAIRSGAVPAAVTYDLLTHELDLRGALGVEGPPDAVALQFLADGFGFLASRRVQQAGLGALELRDPGGGWSAGSPGGVVASATEYEWARALTGRRSERQVSDFGWSADPGPYLDLLCPFGPLPTADVIE